MRVVEGTFQGLADVEIGLFQAVLRGRAGCGVEIGCMDGFSSVVILDASEMHLTSIDPIIPDSMEPSLLGSVDRLQRNMAPYGARHIFIQDYSHRIAPSWKDPIDFLFVDGDHRFEAVMRDLSDWAPFLRPGGLLAMHDCRMRRPGGAKFHVGPSMAADEFIFSRPSEFRVVGEVYSLAVAEKQQ